MKILFCSDASPQAEHAIRFGGIIAAACQAEVTLLGIAEQPGQEPELLQALGHGQQLLKDRASNVEIISRAGDRVEQIVRRTKETPYDLVVIGAVRKETRGAFWMPAKAYKIIKLLTPPVLTVIGARTHLQKILVCSGGKNYIEKAVDLTAKIACGANAKVTLVHVMAAPPPVYTGLFGREGDTERLLRSATPLGRNLNKAKQSFEALGVSIEVSLRHGEVMRELLRETRRADYDLIVAGSSPGRGPLQTYIMGDITREILNQAECPVLVVRTGEASNLPEGVLRFLSELKQAFGPRSGPNSPGVPTQRLRTAPADSSG